MAPPAGLADVALLLFHLIAPALEEGANAAVCLTGGRVCLSGVNGAFIRLFV